MAKQAAKKPAAKKASKTSGKWGRNYYIPGYGHVAYGNEITSAQMDAWNAYSNAKPKVLD